MSGHNKWSSIKHKKGKADAARGREFTKVTREIITAAKIGGGDPEGNSRLRAAILAAKGVNMPNDNINRAIKKGTGDLEGVSYEEFMYEGYGPNGVAVLVKVLTDNKNRTVADIRHTFTKYNGNLGETGCVNWMFTQEGDDQRAQGRDRRGKADRDRPRTGRGRRGQRPRIATSTKSAASPRCSRK